MNGCLNHHKSNQTEELLVVLLANAVVQIQTVVVKHLGASVAPPAVFSLLPDMALTLVAEEVKNFIWEGYINEFTVPLQLDEWVTRVSFGSDESQHKHYDMQHRQD